MVANRQWARPVEDGGCGGINPYTLTAKFGLARIDGFDPLERRRAAQLT